MTSELLPISCIRSVVSLRNQCLIHLHCILSLWKVPGTSERDPPEVESTVDMNQNTGTCRGLGRTTTVNTSCIHSGFSMSIEQAELLKRELTDKWVVVAEEVPELQRFQALTGVVKTVNMNCRALVEFDGVEDISWYDIDPQFLTIVDGPRPKPAKQEKATPAASKKSTPVSNAAGGNPLDMIRAGGSAKPVSGGSPLDAIRASAGGAKPATVAGSPLDKIRAQAGGSKPSTGGSPLDKIRAQAAPVEKTSAEPAPAVDTTAAKPVEKKPAPTGSPLDQIRAQGGFKG